MRALQLCNGKIDFSLPLISQEIRDMLPVIERNGVISRCEKGDAILPDQEYKLYSARYIRSACAIFKGGWAQRIETLMQSLGSDARLG